MGKCVIANRECPRTNDSNARHYCPAWSDGISWTNMDTGQEKVLHCSFEALMPSLIEVIKASNRPAAAIESTRNELAKGFSTVSKVMQTALALENQRKN